ncbi:MAG: pilus assembly protein PilM, partial [Planctomycetota bacterium]
MEIGSAAVKALLLTRDDSEVRVLDHIIVPHPKVLSAPDVDEAEAIRLSLGALVSQRNLRKADVAITAPGSAGFARFAKLPPVEPKKVPDIVK